jgi:hypothetical protein
MRWEYVVRFGRAGFGTALALLGPAPRLWKRRVKQVAISIILVQVAVWLAMLAAGLFVLGIFFYLAALPQYISPAFISGALALLVGIVVAVEALQTWR